VSDRSCEVVKLIEVNDFFFFFFFLKTVFGKMISINRSCVT